MTQGTQGYLVERTSLAQAYHELPGAPLPALSLRGHQATL